MLSGIPLDNSQFISPFSGIHLIKNGARVQKELLTELTRTPRFK